VHLRATVLGFAALLAVAAPSAASAGTDLPVGEADGVRIVRERGALVVVFTPRADRLRRQVAGRRVSVFCTEFTADGEHGGGVTMRAPRKGRRIRTGDLTRGMDYCRVWLRRKTGRRLIVSVPLTQRGAVHLDEEARAGDIMAVLFLAGYIAERRHLDRWPTPAELLQRVGERAAATNPQLVALASPADTPPAGAVGYYSDGAQHAAAVMLSATGRRLFYESEGDGVIRTNLAEYVYGDLD
jgi:hypothetical protein